MVLSPSEEWGQPEGKSADSRMGGRGLGSYGERMRANTWDERFAWLWFAVLSGGVPPVRA